MQISAKYGILLFASQIIDYSSICFVHFVEKSCAQMRLFFSSSFIFCLCNNFALQGLQKNYAVL